MRSFLLGLILLLAAVSPSSAWPQQPKLGPIVPAKTITRSQRAFLATYDRDAAMKALPADAKNYRYVLVKGLFGNTYPGYMSRNAKALKEAGLAVEFAPINTAAGVADNAKILAEMIRTSDKPIVFVTHSKGTADAVAAITQLHAQDPKIVGQKVRGVVSLTGAYRGSPIADLLAESPTGRAAVAKVTKWVGGSSDSILDLRTRVRHEAVVAAPMPTDVVPTVSLVGYGKNYRSILGPGIALLKRAFGMWSDGMVATRSAVINGSDLVRLPISHVQAVYGSYAERVTLGLVDHVLRMPYAL